MKKYLRNNFDMAKYVDVADETPLWSAAFGLKLLDYINYKSGISAIDIGFGTGFPLTEIALRLGDSSTVYGIDPWKEAIDRAYKKIEYFGLSNVRIFEGVAEAIPLDNDSVELITSNNGINNVSDIEKVISECSRIIKPGGQFIQTMNTELTMFEFYEILEQVLSGMNLKNEIVSMREHISLKRPPLDYMISLIQKHGFFIRDLVHDQFNYKFANGSTLLNHYFIRLAFMDSWVKFLPADKLELIFDSVESRLNKKALSESGVNLSIPFVLINAFKKIE